MADENDKRPGLEAESAEMLQVKVKVEPPESYVYSNLSGMAVSPFEVRLHFAEVLPTGSGVESDVARVRTVAGVILPPEHAAALAMLLVQQLQNYERQFGLIRHRPWREMMEATAKSAMSLDKDA